jgi:peptidoglycan/xylan/chitin deacetylase (PgdA/CDA1 family)
MRRVARAAVPRALTWSGLRPLAELLRRRLEMPYVVGVAYHWTPAEEARTFDAHLAWFGERFRVLDRPGLDGFFAGTLALDRPGLLVCFDDGNRNTHEVAAPLLEKHGMRGWFFALAGANDASLPATVGGVHRRLLMSSADLRDLRERGHEVGSHSWSHADLARLSGDALAREIAGSKAALEDAVGAPVESFAWPFGTVETASRESVALARATYRYVFTSCPATLRPSGPRWCIGRHALAAGTDAHRVRLATSGLLDAKYARRRRRFLALGRGAP